MHWEKAKDQPCGQQVQIGDARKQQKIEWESK